MNKAKHPLNKQQLIQRLTNGNTQPEYALVMIFKAVHCFNCEKIILMKDVIVCRTTDELIKRAEKEHTDKVREANILCGTYKPVISFDNAYILTTLLNEAG